MANTASAAKQARVALRRRTINRSTLKTVRTSEKKIRSLAKAGQTDEALKLFPKFQSEIDRAAKKGVVKKNTASRHKERVSKLLKAPYSKEDASKPAKTAKVVKATKTKAKLAKKK